MVDWSRLAQNIGGVLQATGAGMAGGNPAAIINQMNARRQQWELQDIYDQNAEAIQKDPGYLYELSRDYYAKKGDVRNAMLFQNKLFNFRENERKLKEAKALKKSGKLISDLAKSRSLYKNPNSPMAKASAQIRKGDIYESLSESGSAGMQTVLNLYYADQKQQMQMQAAQAEAMKEQREGQALELAMMAYKEGDIDTTVSLIAEAGISPSDAMKIVRPRQGKADDFFRAQQQQNPGISFAESEQLRVQQDLNLFAQKKQYATMLSRQNAAYRKSLGGGKSGGKKKFGLYNSYPSLMSARNQVYTFTKMVEKYKDVPLSVFQKQMSTVYEVPLIGSPKEAILSGARVALDRIAGDPDPNRVKQQLDSLYNAIRQLPIEDKNYVLEGLGYNLQQKKQTSTPTDAAPAAPAPQLSNQEYEQKGKEAVGNLKKFGNEAIDRFKTMGNQLPPETMAPSTAQPEKRKKLDDFWTKGK